MANFVISYRIKRLLGFIVLFGLTLGMPFSYAQDYDSEKDLQKNAAKLFEKEEFVKAYPLYSQLLSVYPENIEYNYKLSVCMLYANPDKEKAIPFLQRVTSNLSADKKSNYYMGVAYHLNYQFNKAISWYEKYLSSAPKKEALALNIKHKIQMCKNGLELMTHKSEISVLKKTEIKETEYFRSYDMSIFGGKLLVKPDDFKSAADKDKGERSIIYLGKDANMLFYSSYGTLGTNKDIYLVTKRDNGDWGEPKILSTTINTEYDEEYPVMYPNSNILYFCSKGHNSMGGYDIFKSEYDSSSGSWSKPINLDFAINSADDDILYLTTPDELTAYFSSKRSSILGKINVYKVKLKKRPGEAPVIASAEDIISDETGELENIEEIQEIAQLNVNASEEDFVEPPTTTSETTETSTTSETATFTDLSDEELIDAGKKYVLEIKEDQSKLSNEAEVSFSVASAKKEQSQEKLKEAETILARVENITDPDQKQLALQTAENLKEESAQLERQSEIAFDMSKALAYDANIKQKELVTAENNAVRIESAVKSDQVDESISLLIEQKVLANSGSDSKVGVEEMTRKMKQDANLKESKASESYEKIQFMENEIAEINDEIINLNEQAESTKDPTIKEEILRQAEELGVEMKDTEQELKQTYADAKVFEKEAEELKEEVALFTAVSSEVMQTSSDQISDASEAVAMTEIKEQPAEPTAETEPESSEVAMNTTESTEENTEETAPLVSIVSAEENTAETGLEANGENLSEEDLAKYDINEEAINEALTNEEVKAEVQQVEKLHKEAEDYTAEATSIREKAETIEDPEFRENAIREAEKLETAAADKESEAATGQSSINYYNFQQNVNEFDEFASNNQYLSESDVATATLQKEKSNDLFEESKSARTKAKTLEDPEEKAVELDRARLLEQEAIIVQREALNQLAVKENRVKLEEQKKMDSQMSDNDLAIINKLQEEAEDLYEESEQVRLEASNINDPAAKVAQLNKATALGKKAVQKQKNALNNYEFQSNLTKLAEAASTSSEQLSPTQKTRLETLQEEFDDLLKQSVEARVDADDTASVIASADLLEKAVDLEELAIQKQFEVMGMYGIETPEPSADLALKTTTDESSLEAEEATLTPSSPASTDQAINATPETEASTEQTEMIEPEDPRSAEELISVSEAQKREANRLYDQIEVIEDPILLMETLDKAEKLEKQAEVNMALA
ncbi:MAG TPA: hypothetical protein EYN69_12830, partial [Flavobacteriales bacterium]|nr:hypothetical protein [Flavobacteriales bacterium]